MSEKNLSTNNSSISEDELHNLANEGASLDFIVTTLKANEKTIGEHTRRLVQAGLINKTYRGHFVEHTLSPYGKSFVQFLKSFQVIM